MSDFLDQYAAQFRAAAEAEAARGHRVATAPLALAGLAAAAVAVAVLGNSTTTLEQELEHPPLVTGGAGYDRQQALLGVLRERTSADDDPQVRQTVRDFRDERPRTGRLLGFASSGSAFVLVATRRYPETVHAGGATHPRPEVRWKRDGLCLMRRGTQGGAGHCGGTADLLAGRLRGAIAGQAYGVVPDGVTHVLPLRHGKTVRVRRNFYVHAVRGNPGPAPVWLDARGREVPKLLPYVNRPGTGALTLLRGRVVVAGFWASWCKPCGPQLRALQTAHERLSDSGVVVTAVATGDSLVGARAALARAAVGFPVFDDREAVLAQRYGASEALPVTVVLNEEGEAVSHLRGRVTAGEIEAAVNRAR